MKIKLNRDLHGHKAGTVIEFVREQHKDQVYWLRRLDDAAIDKCVEVLKSGKRLKKPAAK